MKKKPPTKFRKKKIFREPDRLQAHKRGYDHRWRKARAIFLGENPLCIMCMKEKPRRVTAATVVDHIKPHRGDMELFWDQDNWQPLCVFHHSSVKQKEERGRVSVQIGEDGWPVD